MAIESVCLFLPSEIILPVAGYLVQTGRFALLIAAMAVGSTLAYDAAALCESRRWLQVGSGTGTSNPFKITDTMA
jgi:membrane protein DedA with SNARE-associated domain